MYDSLLSLSPALKLGLTLLSVVVLMRARVPLGGALLAGSCLLEMFFPLPLRNFLAAVVEGLLSEKTAFLAAIVLGLLIFSEALNTTGQIRRIIGAFTALVGKSRLALIAFPALIGLLPMPGGAIFSAPMVEAAVEGADITPARTSAANYWFRHIWEYWFPLYPGIILFLTLTEVPAGRFILMQLPMTACAVAAGYLVILRGVRLSDKSRRDFSRPNLRRFAGELVPILLVVASVAVVSAVLGLVLPAEFDPSAGGGFLFRARSFLRTRVAADSILVRNSPVLAGLLLGGAWLFARRSLTWKTLAKLSVRKSILAMLFLVLGLRVFQSVLENCGAVVALSAEFESSGVALAVAVSALPFICGFVVGIAFGYVGASFPLVILLLAGMPPGERLPYYCLAYIMGYTGMMLSPVHICLVLTNQYFKSHLLRVYGYLLPVSLLSAGFGVFLFLLYRLF